MRKAQKEDVHHIYRLICILENKDLNQDYFQKEYIKALDHENAYFFVETHDDRIIGFISFYIKHYLHHEHPTGEIAELVVDPMYRNQHIGRRLIMHVEELAKQLGLEEIELSTSTYRIKAHHFYETMGYCQDHLNYTKKL